MTTLIAVYNSSGCVGRCDAKCYNAKETDCDCICGGKNHGAGLEKACENTEELQKEWIEEYTKRKALSEYIAEVNGTDTRQLSLAFL